MADLILLPRSQVLTHAFWSVMDEVQHQLMIQKRHSVIQNRHLQTQQENEVKGVQDAECTCEAKHYGRRPAAWFKRFETNVKRRFIKKSVSNATPDYPTQDRSRFH